MRHILFRGEDVHGAGFERFARAENHGREFGFVGRIGIVLRFEAEAAVIEMVAGVKLDAGLVGAEGHDAAGFWIFDASGFFHGTRGARPSGIDDEVMVVAVQLRFELIDAFADACWFREVQWSAFDAGEFAGGNEAVVRGSVLRGVELKDVIENVALAREVKVGVVGEVDDGGFVGGGFVIDAEFVLVGEGVGDFRGEGPRIILFAIFADVSELNGRFVQTRREELYLSTVCWRNPRVRRGDGFSRCWRRVCIRRHRA